MSRGRAAHEGVATCFPRVSGDEPYADLIGMLLDAFSPRERG